MYTDKILTYPECGMNFTFTTGEQEFFASKGFTNEPSRCPDCRGARSRNRNESYAGAGGGYGGGGYERQREMFPAVCAQCGKDTQVPFQPRGDRPVYCSDCLAIQRGSNSGGGGGGNRNRW